MIALKAVTSKAMQAYGYDAATQVLAVRFGPGKVYHYQGVPADMVKEMEEAESLGSFFGRNIRRYTATVVLDEEEVKKYDNGAPMFSTTTFKENGDPIMLDENGKRSVFCDVDE
jgi:hypothetical protein